MRRVLCLSESDGLTLPPLQQNMLQGPFTLETGPRNLTRLEIQILEALNLLSPPSKCLHSGLAWCERFQQAAGALTCARGLLAQGCLAILNSKSNHLPPIYSFNFQSFKEHLKVDSCFIFKQSFTAKRDVDSSTKDKQLKPRKASKGSKGVKDTYLPTPGSGHFLYYPNIFKCLEVPTPGLNATWNGHV